MGTTTNGLPYPEPTDDLRDGAGAIEALAEALDPAALDTGWLTASSLYTPASGVTVSTFEIRRVGRWAQLRTVFTLPSLPNVNTSGDCSNTTAFTLTDARFIPARIGSLNSSGVGRAADGLVLQSGSGTPGAVQVAAITPDATQTGTVTISNVQLSLGGTYLVD